jgi:hypothetical protein
MVHNGNNELQLPTLFCIMDANETHIVCYMHSMDLMDSSQKTRQRELAKKHKNNDIA